MQLEIKFMNVLYVSHYRWCYCCCYCLCCGCHRRWIYVFVISENQPEIRIVFLGGSSAIWQFNLLAFGYFILMS